MRNVRILFFDMGCTLADETPALKERCRLTAETEGARKLGVTAEDVMRAMEDAAARRLHPYRTALAALGLTEAIPYRSELDEMDKDAPRILRALKDRYTLGVIANQQKGLRDRLTKMGILDFFSIVISSEDYPFSKPDPRLFEAALAAAHVKPHEAVMIGDRIDNDIIPARALGMRTVRLKSGLCAGQTAQTPDETPDIEITRLIDVLNIFM